MKLKGVESEIILELIKAGADINLRSLSGKQSKHSFWCTQIGINITNSGETAIHFATRSGTLKMMRYLENRKYCVINLSWRFLLDSGVSLTTESNASQENILKMVIWNWKGV